MSPKIDKLRYEAKKGFFNIFPKYCKGCGLCTEKCPYQVLDWSDELGIYGTPIVEPVNIERCTACGLCEMFCPDCAIVIEKKRKKKAFGEFLSGIKVKDMMSEKVQAVNTKMSIKELVEEFYRYKFGAFPVVDGSIPKGLITMNMLKDIPKLQWSGTEVGKVMVPLEQCLVVHPESEAAEVMMQMASDGSGRALVVQDERLIGIVSNTDIMRLIKIRTMFGSLAKED